MRGKRRNSPELPDASAGTPEERRERARQDFTFFRRAYFPHYCLVGGDSRLHEWLDAELPRMADAPEGVRLAIAAPRGEAKSTFVSLFFVLWAVLTGRKTVTVSLAREWNLEGGPPGIGRARVGGTAGAHGPPRGGL